MRLCVDGSIVIWANGGGMGGNGNAPRNFGLPLNMQDKTKKKNKKYPVLIGKDISILFKLVFILPLATPTANLEA